MNTVPIPALEGEDRGAYSAAVITAITQELIGPVEYNRMSAKPTAWYSLLIKELIQRIANLREIAATKSVALDGQHPEPLPCVKCRQAYWHSVTCGFGDGYYNSAPVLDSEREVRDVSSEGVAVPEGNEVEAALAELREMFPAQRISIKESRWWLLFPDVSLEPCVELDYLITVGKGNNARCFTEDTIAEAMQAVRQWAAGQKGT